MAKRDFYEVLGISRSADADEIKKAYRALARKHHPDVNKAPDAQKKFTEIQEAYDALSDDKRKALYDRQGHAGLDPAMGAGGGGAGSGRGPHYSWSNVGGRSGGGPEDASDLSDLFETFFAGRRPGTRASTRQSHTRRHTPEPSVHDLAIDFQTAASGGTATLAVGGRTIDVKIPRAVVSGAKLRVPANATGEGDVLIRLTVKPHALFRRRAEGKSLDLEVDLPLSIPEAVFGARVAVPTLDGVIEMTVPPGAGGGKALRLKAKGLDNGAAKGDLYVYPRVIAPRSDDLPKKLRDALERERDAFPSPRTGDEWGPRPARSP